MRSHKLLAAVAGLILLSTPAAAQDIETAVSKLSWREIGRKMTYDWSVKSGDAGIGIIERFYSPQ